LFAFKEFKCDSRKIEGKMKILALIEQVLGKLWEYSLAVLEKLIKG
jgi:hypothetical protein